MCLALYYALDNMLLEWEFWIVFFFTLNRTLGFDEKGILSPFWTKMRVRSNLYCCSRH